MMSNQYNTHFPFLQVFLLGGLLLALAAGLSGCKPLQTPAVVAATPLAALPSPTPSPASSPTPFAPEQTGQAAMADWEEMFRITNSYESVSSEGRPGDKDWWLEQTNRFYTGSMQISQSQVVERLFDPKSEGEAPGFIQGARYILNVEACPSITECKLRVSLQAGRFWVYDIRGKQWQAVNQVAPGVWTVTMQYDPGAGRWKVAGGP